MITIPILCALSFTCVKETEYFYLSSGTFCLEEIQMCCSDDVCEEKFAIACYPNKTFVGNFESLIKSG